MIVHIIILIPGEMWSKGNNCTNLLLVEVFVKVAEVDNEALNISLGENMAEEKPRQNVFSYSYLGILFAAAKNTEIQGL